MLKSILTKWQKRHLQKKINYEGKFCTMSVTLRYDDECNKRTIIFAEGRA